MENVFVKELNTPVGILVAAAGERGIFMLDFKFRSWFDRQLARVTQAHPIRLHDGEHPWHAVLERELDAYFSGAARGFSLPLVFSGSGFQRSAWESLTGIPYGKTVTYMEQARKLGNPDTVRAVARANGENCHALLVPCHRVVGANNDLTGYSGGLAAKKWLIDHERRVSGLETQLPLF